MLTLIVILIWVIGVIIAGIIIGLFGDCGEYVRVVDKLIVAGCFAMFALLWPAVIILGIAALIPGSLIMSVVYLKQHK
jgi:hypothetical protein